ncbi:MAG: hypothetical protein LIP23_09675, partial [Planctomycetes bacterium]|nr:hypothetical protein [Planctomycetota bacterium]
HLAELVARFDTDRNAMGEAVEQAGEPGVTGETEGASQEAKAADPSGQAATLTEALHSLQQQVADISTALQPEKFDALAQLIRETGETLDQRLAAQQEQLAAKISETLHASAAERGDADAVPPGTPELDLDYLARRIAGEMTRHAPAAADPGNPSMVDALAAVAEQLVNGQNANTIKLDNLSEEIHSAVRALTELDNWHGRLPDRVADEIGRTVHERVVEPISTALAKQAPAILSELQDNKLVDIVSRSVREAQRPLLREILARGKGGIPAWLFAAVLLPLLLILGYLFLPGTFGDSGEDRARLEGELSALADSVHRVEAGGVPLRADVEDRLQNIEEVVMDIHGEALAHAKNAAALEEEARGLRETLGERDRLIKEYTELLQRQVRRIRAYETRLTRLGVSPDSVEE